MTKGQRALLADLVALGSFSVFAPWEYRMLRALHAAGFVEKVEGSWRPTDAGRVALAAPSTTKGRS